METQEPDKKISPVKKKKKNQFEDKYCQLYRLGDGGQGSVYVGYRKKDFLRVAIKHIPQTLVFREDDDRSKMPLEVLVMMKMSQQAGGSVGQSASISLLDHYDLEEELIIVMECPFPAVDLLNYRKSRGGTLEEEEARLFFKQLVEAVRELDANKIFHADIKMENILVDISSGVPRLRIIDFGLSMFINDGDTIEDIFPGAPCYDPPEWYWSSVYSSRPVTVWQMGVVLHDMLHRDFNTTFFLENGLRISQELSPNCQNVLRLCLAEDPQQRPTLEQLLSHSWLE
ncbi:serine/threonine-protein kinase pim-3-like [Antennarius striatus]|uniref:serine/threonine-protein kinase pim-3-like n=1 Tax=Antennarius striatus TaxID=241820 RepID=UPI0035B18A6C